MCSVWTGWLMQFVWHAISRCCAQACRCPWPSTRVRAGCTSSLLVIVGDENTWRSRLAWAPLVLQIFRKKKNKQRRTLLFFSPHTDANTLPGAVAFTHAYVTHQSGWMHLSWGRGGGARESISNTRPSVPLPLPAWEPQGSVTQTAQGGGCQHIYTDCTRVICMIHAHPLQSSLTWMVSVLKSWSIAVWRAQHADRPLKAAGCRVFAGCCRRVETTSQKSAVVHAKFISWARLIKGKY